MEVYTNKTSIELVMTATRATVANACNLAVAGAELTSTLPMLAEKAVKATLDNAEGIGIGMSEGIAALVDGNLCLLARIRQLQGRKEGETALEYYTRLKQEAAAEQPPVLPKEATNK